MRTLLAAALALLVAVPVAAKRPAPAPRIIGFTNGCWDGPLWAISSIGEILEFQFVQQAFGEYHVEVNRVIGNLFGGPPPSPIVDTACHSGLLVATLENGDVFWMTESQGQVLQGYADNIFAAAVPGARFDLPPMNFAAPIVLSESDPDSPEMPLKPGAAR